MTDAADIMSRVAQLELGFDSYEVDTSVPEPTPDADLWLQFGVTNHDMTRETAYCDEQLIKDVFELRSSLDSRADLEIKRARQRTNFFEVKSEQFMNRAAVKIANVDAAFDWLLCQLPGQGEDEDGDGELLYFVDIFGGPGGCSEYILWRNGGWKARGFGFSTFGDYEFLLEDFRAIPPETLDPFYGPNDEGNLFDPVNIRGFTDYVMAHTEKLGVHLLVCDGGFLIKNNSQEVISKQLYLLLTMLAVSVIRPGGKAIIKVFDLYTPFSVGLVYILTRAYAKVSIMKPSSSRPANSERYVVCQNRLNRNQDMGEFLFSVNKVLWENRETNFDILHIVSDKLIAQDADFCHFIRNSNNELARRQIKGLENLIQALDKGFRPKPVDQRLVQATLWRSWKLDHETPLVPMLDANSKSAQDYALQFIDEDTMKMFCSSGATLNDTRPLQKTFGVPKDWSFVALDVTVDQGKTIRTMFVSKGNGNVFAYEKKKAEWRQIKDYQLILSPQTILYGEIVEEIQMKEGSQRSLHALHIIDAIILGGVDIRSHPLAKRNALCAKFATALNRPLCHLNNTTVQSIPVRAKQFYALNDMERFFNNVTINQLANGTKVVGCDVERFEARESNRFYIPRALLFVRHSQDGPRKVLNFDRSFKSRQVWMWSKTNQIYSAKQYSDVKKEPKLVYRVDFEAFIDQFEED